MPAEKRFAAALKRLEDKMETTWTVDTPDHAKIYGVKNSHSENATSAIFIVHGLTGHMNEYAFKRAADHFSKNYDVYRFNLYDGQDGGRSLIDCTIQTHADDLNLVLNHFRKKYQNIFLIGHSYGGPTIMLANPDKIAAFSLWDPSFNLKHIQEEFSKNYVENDDHYTVNWGTSYLISKAMYEEANRLNKATCIELAKKNKHPVQVIHAGNGFYINDDVSYHSYGNPNNVRDIVEGSVHCFHEGDTCDALLQKTELWFKKAITLPHNG